MPAPTGVQVNKPSNNPSWVVEYDNPEHFIDSRVYVSGRYPYSRENDRTVNAYSTPFGNVSVGMWLGGPNKVEQQDAVFLGIDVYENLWMVVADGLGGHPGGAQASQVCCDVLESEITKVGFRVDGALRDRMRIEMAKNEVIMSDPYRIGGACIAMVRIDGNSHKLKCYSMGDVEVGVLRKHQGLVLANSHDTGIENNQVSKTLSPAGQYDFTETEFCLVPEDKILVASDGLQNYAFKAFGFKNITCRQQVEVAIEISRHRQKLNSDNLSIMCLDSFMPPSTEPTHSSVQLMAD